MGMKNSARMGIPGMYYHKYIISNELCTSYLYALFIFDLLLFFQTSMVRGTIYTISAISTIHHRGLAQLFLPGQWLGSGLDGADLLGALVLPSLNLAVGHEVAMET